MKRFIFYLIVVTAIIAVQLNAQVTLDLKVFLEGPFNGTEMKTDLNFAGLIPLSQPYNVAPWNYTGTEQVTSIPNADIVDWILVELRETTGDASTATPDKMINRQATFIKADGSIVATDGGSMITYAGAITVNLYVIIWHRNHLAIMSSGPLTNAGGIYSWDFTDQLFKAYLSGQQDIGGGKFGMIGGDCNASGRVNTIDEDFNWSRQAGNSGYYLSDINIDTEVNNIDKDEIWFKNIGEIVQLPEGVSFYCGAELEDNRDGQFYNTVPIDTQCWMAENLNIGIMIPGANIMANNNIIEKYCYGNLTTRCDIYGGLYQWDEMMQYSTTPGVQGICPVSWHLATDAEWCTLTQFIDPTVDCNTTTWSGTDVGTKMKSTTGWNSGGNGTNASGFTALPGGGRGYNPGGFFSLGSYADFWSSTEYGTNNAWHRVLNYGNAGVVRDYDNKTGGFSVRCLQD